MNILEATLHAVSRRSTSLLSSSSLSSLYTLCLLSAVPAALPAALNAQVVLAPSTPQIGSSNPVSAEPNVKRPTTTPCKVQLFSSLVFADYTPKNFN